MKYFVLDTNVLLHNAQAISSFADNTVVLPMTVIEELDSFKRHNDELGRNARSVIRTLDTLRTRGHLSDGVPMENGGQLIIHFDQGKPYDIGLNMTVPDNRILATAVALHEEGKKVIFVSKDINARLKADALGLEVMDFEREKVNFDVLFTGHRTLEVDTATIDRFYQEPSIEFDDVALVPNEFVLLVDQLNPKHSALARALSPATLGHLSQKSDSVWGVTARSKEQRMAIELLLDPKVQLVTLVGQAGTGKTLLALAAGLTQVTREQRYDKLLVSRPVIPLGKDIGYLPGTKDEKLTLWMQPIFDNLTFLMATLHDQKMDKRNGENDDTTVRQQVEKLIRTNTVELEALTYIRGRSIPKQYMVVDEAQNLTPHEVKTIVSRAGEGTKVVLTGDPYQIDNPYLDSSSNGLSYTVERLKGSSLVGHITLQKSVRSPLSALAAENL